MIRRLSPSRRGRWALRRWLPLVGLVAACTFAPLGCRSGVGRPAVSLALERPRTVPRDASVYIDERYIGPLYFVSARGVRLPVGEHRITVTREGYFPWDRLVEAGRKPITLKVALEPIPD